MTERRYEEDVREPIRILVTRVGTKVEGLEVRMAEQTEASQRLAESVNTLPERIRVQIYEPLDKRLAAVEKDLAKARGAIQFIQIVGTLAGAAVAFVPVIKGAL